MPVFSYATPVRRKVLAKSRIRFPKFNERRSCDRENRSTMAMRVLLSILVLGLLGIASAISTSGNRLLVILEELAEKDKYSKFFGGLTGNKIQTGQ